MSEGDRPPETRAKNDLRLGIIATVPSARVADGIVANHSAVRLIRELASRFESAVLATSVLPVQRPSFNEVLMWPSERLVELPPMGSTLEAQKHGRAVRRGLRFVASASDVLFIRAPIQIPWAILGLGVPKVIHFVGEASEVARVSTDYSGLQKAGARAFCRLADALYRRAAREPGTRLVCNGSALRTLYGEGVKGRTVVSSCLHQSEMPGKTVLTREGRTPSILFVGYLRPEKGVETLIKAFEQVRQRYRVSLTMVGGSDKTNGAEYRRLEGMIASSPYRDDIRQMGEVAFGPSLFELFRTHMMLVLPSLTEGTPRVLVEARAFGCPVIASDVGGVPDSVRHGEDGLLVPPGKVTDLADAMQLLLRDETTWSRLSASGWETSQSRSVERFVSEIERELLAAVLGVEPS